MAVQLIILWLGGTHPAEALLLESSREYMRCQVLNSGWLNVRQMSYPRAISLTPPFNNSNVLNK